MAILTPDNLFKLLGVLGGVIGWVYQVRSNLVRSKIKTDLEIFEKAKELFGVDDERTRRIEIKLTSVINNYYRNTQPVPQRRIDWASLVVGGLCAIGAIAFGWGRWEAPLEHWVSLLGALFLAMIGLGAFFNAFDVATATPSRSVFYEEDAGGEANDKKKLKQRADSVIAD